MTGIQHGGYKDSFRPSAFQRHVRQHMLLFCGVMFNHRLPAGAVSREENLKHFSSSSSTR